ncbi:MAG TPA: hypothetical protein VFZ75_09635 [Actinomycetota bacterium]|nr:hypothetical protein [Actinomycetota bacterium]
MNVRSEGGLAGKMVVLWLLVLAVLALGAIDVASIAFTTYKLSDVGTRAAGEGALVFRRERNVRDTCERVAEILAEEEPGARVARGGCTVERPSGLVTVRIRERASTLVVERIPWTEEFATVVVTEVAGPPSL